MLVNATQEAGVRVALVDGQNCLPEYRLPSREQKKPTFTRPYLARRALASSCFVDYGAQRHGFLR